MTTWSNTAKYNNKKTEVFGHTFDSKREARRYLELWSLEKAGKIKNLMMQVPYELIPSQRRRGRVVERACVYKADFVYYDLEKDEEVVEDAKGMRTKDYIIKRKLMLYVHNIQIKEV